jgi:endonuclease
MSIYERPTKDLMHDFARDRLKPGQVFEKRDAVQWFKDRYPRIKSNTVGMHVEGMAINSPHRKHHPNIRPGANFDLFFKLEPGRFRLWNRETDGEPKYRDYFLKDESHREAEAPEIDEPGADENGQREFAFEHDLRNYLARNLGVLEQGLRLYEDEDGEFRGTEYPVGGRFIDILAVDSNGGFVVIELKVSRGYDRVVGQLLRYMAWIKNNLASGKPVRGLIVASDITEDLRLAASLVEGIGLWQYKLSFSLEAVSK